MKTLRPLWLLPFLLVSIFHPTLGFNSFIKPALKPVHQNVHFAQSTDIYLKTGEAVINFEIPLQAAACFSHNFNKAVHAAHPIQEPFGHELRVAKWGKLRMLDNITAGIDETLEIMGFKTAIKKNCDLPKYQVYLDVNPQVRKAKRPSPPATKPLPKIDPNCQALRIGASCAVRHRSRRSPGHRPTRRKRQIVRGLTQIATQKLGEMAASTIKRHLKKELPQADRPTYDGWNIFLSVAEKITRGIAGMNFGSIVSAGGDIANMMTYFKVSSRLNKLTEHVSEIDTKVGQLTINMVEVLTSLKEDRLGHMYERIKDYIYEFKLELDRILVSIVQGYFPRDMFEMLAFTKAVDALELEANQNSDTLLDKSPMAALQSKMGWAYEDTGNLNVHLRTDITRTSLKMVLHQIFLTPIQTATGRVIIVMTENEYKTCRNVAGKLICPDARVVHKKDLGVTGYNDAMCVHATFTMDNAGIKQYCTYTRPRQEENIQSVSDNEFLGYSNRSLTIHVKCNTLGEDYLQTQPGAFILELPDGCKADAPAHTVWNIYLLAAQSIYLQRRWTPPEALTTFGNHTAKDIGFLIDTSKTLNDLTNLHLLEQQHREATKQRQEQELAQRKLQESQNNWFGPGAILFASLCAIIVAAIIFYCGCIYQQKLRNCCLGCCSTPSEKNQPLNTQGHHQNQPVDDEHVYAPKGPTPASRTTGQNPVQ